MRSPGPREEGGPPPVQAGWGSGLALTAVLAVAFAIRAYYASFRHVCFGDESCYLWLARNLFSGAGYYYHDPGTAEVHFPPLFPVALGVLNWLVRDWEAVSRVAYVVFGGLLPLPVYLLGRDMYGVRVGLIAAGLTAVLPAFTSGVLFAETLSEPLYLLCLFTGMRLVYTSYVRGSLARSSLAGCALSLAYLTRPAEGTVFMAVGLAFLVIVHAWRRPLRAPAAILRLAAYVGGFLLVASPYVVFLRMHTGEWALTTKCTKSYTTTRALVAHDGVQFQRDTWGLNPGGEIHYFARESGQSLASLLRGPYRDRVIPDIKANLRSAASALLHLQVFGRVMVLIALAGLATCLFFRRNLEAEILNLLMVAALSSVLIYFIRERFLYNILLPLILWAACALDLPSTLWERRRPRAADARGARLGRAACSALLAAAVSLWLVDQGHKYFQRKRTEHNEVWDAAAWIQRNTPNDATVMSTGPEVAFHAGRRWLPVPFAERERVVDYGRRKGASYLCLRGRYLERRPEQRRELFDDAKSFEDLDLLVKVGKDPSETSFVVYRLKEPAK